MKPLWALIALPFITSAALAQTDEEVIAALNNVQHEMSRCIAYNMIVVECLKTDDDLAET